LRLCPACGGNAPHEPCAICDTTNSYTRLCSTCRADPLNADWGETWEEFGREDDIASLPHERSSALSMDDLLDRRMRVTTLQTRILELVARVEVEVYVRRDRHGRHKGKRQRQRALSSREIAKRLHCTQSYVVRVRRRFLGR
jgi:hypothetical protein